MRTLVFDGRTGAAGDMICAALIAAGADESVLTVVESELPVKFEIGSVEKNGIHATTVDVLTTDTTPRTKDGADTDTDASVEHAQSHHAHDEHTHDGHTHDGQTHDEQAHHEHGESGQSHHYVGHEDGNKRGHIDEHEHAEGHGPHRSYDEVVSLVQSMALPASVTAIALEAFELLGHAEATVHGTDLTTIHFHEVGADDAIADVVGAALLVDDLDIDRVVTTPLAAGGGSIRMHHGTYPVPAPAVVEIASRTGLTLQGGPVDRELLTPTGAAILGVLADPIDNLPRLQVEASGYGAGDATFASHPNVLRAMIGDGETELAAGGLLADDVAVLETQLDDASPEILGGLQETLHDAGARDVSVVPTTMKKSRPGHLVRVVCKPADAASVAERLARETGTLGIRQTGATHRWIADRAFETATLKLDGSSYEISVKVAATNDGEVYDVSAEYDDAATVAGETGLPIRDVMQRAEGMIRQNISGR